jgi:hypothetical protein
MYSNNISRDTSTARMKLDLQYYPTNCGSVGDERTRGTKRVGYCT